MTISSHANKAAAHLYDHGYPDQMTCATIIQSAIDNAVRELLGLGDAEVTPGAYVEVLKSESRAFENLSAYVAQELGVKGSHSVYDDIDMAKMELERLRKLT